MSRNDMVSDNLTCIRNAVQAKKDDVTVPYSNFFSKICEMLKEEGYIENFRKLEEGKKHSLKVYLKYMRRKSVITKIRRISKPSLRIYVSKDKVPSVLRGRGTAFISTSHGLLTDKQARKSGLGGEVLFKIW
ncbi:30S ribosomal protein S8 [Candidatus Omnitrophota bacterium]